MNDSTFYCIVNNRQHYYLGYYKNNSSSGYLYPAVSRLLSDALKLTFKEEAESIVHALGKKMWRIKQIVL